MNFKKSKIRSLVLLERNRTSSSPRKVNGVLDLSGVVVGVRSAHTDSTDLPFGTGIGDDLLQRRGKFLDVRLDSSVGV